MGNRQAEVADNDDESQGRDACMDHLDRSRARIDRSACALRAAHTCPRTWTIVKTRFLAFLFVQFGIRPGGLLSESKLYWK